MLSEILPGALSLTRLQGLTKLDEEQNEPSDAILRLAALLTGPRTAEALADKLKFSNADRDRLVALTGAEKLPSDLLVQRARVLLYKRGSAWFGDMVRLNWAQNPNNAVEWRKLLQLAKSWQQPNFPLDGRDAMAAGLQEGPELGRALAELEQWWIDNDFKPDRAALLARLNAIARVKGG